MPEISYDDICLACRKTLSLKKTKYVRSWHLEPPSSEKKCPICTAYVKKFELNVLDFQTFVSKKYKGHRI